MTSSHSLPLAHAALRMCSAGRGRDTANGRDRREERRVLLTGRNILRYHFMDMAAALESALLAQAHRLAAREGMAFMCLRACTAARCERRDCFDYSKVHGSTAAVVLVAVAMLGPARPTPACNVHGSTVLPSAHASLDVAV